MPDGVEKSNDIRFRADGKSLCAVIETIAVVTQQKLSILTVMKQLIRLEDKENIHKSRNADLKSRCSPKRDRLSSKYLLRSLN